MRAEPPQNQLLLSVLPMEPCATGSHLLHFCLSVRFDPKEINDTCTATTTPWTLHTYTPRATSAVTMLDHAPHPL